MTEKSDRQLLEAFVHESSQKSFEMLVERFSGMVYASALRKICNSSMAEDVAQLVFLSLAQKAPSLLSRENLGPWLHKVTIFQACKMIRTEERRKKREKNFSDSALEISAEESTESTWGELRPVLDDCLIKLSQSDREVIVWRYLENLSVSEVAERCGAKQAAVRKRLQRALVKLSSILKRNQVAMSALTVSILLSRHGVQAAPANLANGISHFVMNRLDQAPISSGSSMTSQAAWIGGAGAALVASVFFLNSNSEKEPASQTGSKSVKTEIKQSSVIPIPIDNRSGAIVESDSDLPVSLDKNANPTPKEGAWWSLIESDDLILMVHHLVTAGFPTEVIEQLLMADSLQGLLAEPEQLQTILKEESFAGMTAHNELKGLWGKMSDEFSRDIHKTLKQGGVPKDLFDIIMTSLSGKNHEVELSKKSDEAPQDNAKKRHNKYPNKNSLSGKNIQRSHAGKITKKTRRSFRDDLDSIFDKEPNVRALSPHGNENLQGQSILNPFPEGSQTAPDAQTATGETEIGEASEITETNDTFEDLEPIESTTEDDISEDELPLSERLKDIVASYNPDNFLDQPESDFFESEDLTIPPTEDDSPKISSLSYEQDPETKSLINEPSSETSDDDFDQNTNDDLEFPSEDDLQQDEVYKFEDWLEGKEIPSLPPSAFLEIKYEILKNPLSSFDQKNQEIILEAEQYYDGFLIDIAYSNKEEGNHGTIDEILNAKYTELNESLDAPIFDQYLDKIFRNSDIYSGLIASSSVPEE